MLVYLKRLFSEHPQSVNESYLEHLFAAAGFSIKLAYAALVCLIHAILPFLFVTRASEQLNALHAKMIQNRNRREGKEKAQAKDSIESLAAFNFEI
jgi:hypothetical protein